LATNKKSATDQNQTADYQHGQQATQRPDVGVQDQFNT
jgi:adenine-specific DNA-methyltransferase